MKSGILIHVTKSLCSMLWSLLVRIFCCRRQTRNGKNNFKSWGEEEEEPMLTSVTVESQSNVQLQNWNSWGDEPVREPTIADKIEAYRSGLQRAPSTENDQKEDVDFFSDMVPSVSQQTKVYIGPSTTSGGSNRLAFAGSAPLQSESEILGAWDESSGWDAEDEGLSQLVKEQRRKQKRGGM